MNKLCVMVYLFVFFSVSISSAAEMCVAEHLVSLMKEPSKSSLMNGMTAIGTVVKSHKTVLDSSGNEWIWIKDKDGYSEKQWFNCMSVEEYNAQLAEEKRIAEEKEREKQAKIAEENKKLKEEAAKSVAEIGEGNWNQGEYTDEFGDPTGDKFVYIKQIGKFSNSSTSGDDLYVTIHITYSNDIGIFLREYNLQRPNVFFIGDDGFVMMKNSKKEVLKITRLYKWNQSGGLHINDKRFISFLKKSVGIVKFAIYDSYSSKYFFNINANGFTAAYNKMKQ